MKFKMKKTLLAVVVAGMGVINIAHAGGFDASTMANASADVTFAESGSISNTLTAKSGLKAGAHHAGDVIANGIVHSLNGSAGNFILAFADNATWVNSNSAKEAVVKGENTSSPLDLVISTPSNTGTQIDGVYYPLEFSVRDSKIGKTATYKIGLTNDQNVAADTYTIKTSAYVYTD